ncbi:hypothetical protein AJ79_04708 [Helicocarpus griseus UAMH5409]|uniref:Uncharacterized protein n=1 Tax=Helicocarpus griseus UAMH5409 TaxID=1447875 RepID=A0A2B7XRV7_9EURO|nr:hypothetical protein AJ79_04708 [Helicocarpus griseus UAMH5409]
MSTGRDSQAETSKRLEVSLKTKDNEGYSEVIAVSQRAVNANLKFLLILYPELGVIDLKTHSGDMHAQIEAGQISIPAIQGDVYSVDYYVQFKSGSMTPWNDDINDYSPAIDMTGWRFVFGIDLNDTDVDPGTEEHDNVQSAMGHPGDYSISRLYLDFNTHKISNFNEQASDFAGYEWSSQSEKISFLSILLRWADGFTTDLRKSTIGYSLKTDKPETVNESAPTFPPTAQKSQTYPYRAPESKGAVEGLKDGENNMILYMEMTQNLPLPSETILPYSGNFVTPDIDGTICLESSIFVDGYLLRLTPSLILNLLLKHTYARLRRENLGLAQNNEINEKWWEFCSCGYGSGWNPPDEGFFVWDHPTPTTWEWKVGDYYDTSGGNQTIHASATNDSTIEVIPGTNKIVFSGSSYVSFKWEYIQNWWPFPRGLAGAATSTWSMPLTIASVLEGGLEIAVPEITDDFIQTSTSGKGDAQFWDEDFSKSAAYTLKSAVSKIPIQDIAQELRTALTKSAKFTVPGGGTFLYKNPIFSNNGDLLIETQYDG